MSTIAAIATPMATGGIGIIRISGPESRQVADKVFKAKNKKTAAEVKGYTALYGKVYDDDLLLDEAICLVFAAPKSYTGEDVVELSCHGGLYVLNRVLQAVLAHGAALAQPGEFSKRAFMNGKIDLTQADGIMELIGAQSGEAARAALEIREGALSRKTQAFCEILVHAAGHLAAWADFPEEDIEEVETPVLIAQCEEVKTGLENLLAGFETGRMLREGVPTAIAGRPNVGKSTLMNLLAGHEKSIVTAQAGTTRDIVEETVRLGKAVLRLADTAGLRQSDDEAEKIGIDRARKRIEQSALILAVFDGSEPLDDEDKNLIDTLPPKRTVALINKSDKPLCIDEEYIFDRLPHTLRISAQEAETTALSDLVERVLGLENLTGQEAFLMTQRQRQCVSTSMAHVNEAIEALQNGITLDAISVLLDSAIDSLLELTGQKASEQVIDQVFHRFCVGK